MSAKQEDASLLTKRKLETQVESQANPTKKSISQPRLSWMRTARSPAKLATRRSRIAAAAAGVPKAMEARNS